MGDDDHRDDPFTYDQAMVGKDSAKSLEAIKFEMDSILSN